MTTELCIQITVHKGKCFYPKYSNNYLKYPEIAIILPTFKNSSPYFVCAYTLVYMKMDHFHDSNAFVLYDLNKGLYYINRQNSGKSLLVSIYNKIQKKIHLDFTIN